MILEKTNVPIAGRWCKGSGISSAVNIWTALQEVKSTSSISHQREKSYICQVAHYTR